jgi:hypothetical protein
MAITREDSHQLSRGESIRREVSDGVIVAMTLGSIILLGVALFFRLFH